MGCARATPSVPPLASRALSGSNVLLVTIDTLRRDRLGAYGNTTGLTPVLDGLAAAGLRYTHAFSHAPMTLPAHASILTGRIPIRHGIRNNGSYRLGEDVPTLATVIRAEPCAYRRSSPWSTAASARRLRIALASRA